jgi:hypothetical protein
MIGSVGPTIFALCKVAFLSRQYATFIPKLVQVQGIEHGINTSANKAIQ